MTKIKSAVIQVKFIGDYNGYGVCGIRSKSSEVLQSQQAPSRIIHQPNVTRKWQCVSALRERCRSSCDTCYDQTESAHWQTGHLVTTARGLRVPLFTFRLIMHRDVFIQPSADPRIRKPPAVQGVQNRGERFAWLYNAICPATATDRSTVCVSFRSNISILDVVFTSTLTL